MFFNLIIVDMLYYTGIYFFATLDQNFTKLRFVELKPKFFKTLSPSHAQARALRIKPTRAQARTLKISSSRVFLLIFIKLEVKPSNFSRLNIKLIRKLRSSLARFLIFFNQKLDELSTVKNYKNFLLKKIFVGRHALSHKK